MLQFLATSLPFFAVIGLGFAAAHCGLFGPEAIEVLNTFAFVIAIPALVLRVMSGQPLIELWNPTFLAVLSGVGIALMAAGIAWARILGSLPFASAVSRGQMLVGGNFAFLGIPLMLAFLGDRAAAPIALGLICDTAVIVPLSIGLIVAGRGGGRALGIVWRLVRGTIVNPFMLSMIVGAGLSLSGMRLPEPADRFLAFLGGAAAPTGVFALGLALRQWMNAGTLEVLPPVAGKLILHPLLVWAVLALWLRQDPLWVTAGVLYAALPIAANVFVISERYETGSQPIAGAVLLSTALAVLTYPLTMWLVIG